jgi:hypothetical protein
VAEKLNNEPAKCLNYMRLDQIFMKTIPFYCLFIVLFFLGCSRNHNANISENHHDTTNILRSEDIIVASLENDFKEFLDKFNNDSIFQLESIRFPYISKYYIYDEDSYYEYIKDSIVKFIYPKNHSHLLIKEPKTNLTNEEVEMTVEYLNSCSAQVILRGMDSDLFYIFNFRNIDKRWYLIEIIDDSM